MSVNPNYYTIRNRDGKVWLMPSTDLRTAMELYQPSGPKGKLLKRGFPWVHRIGAIRNLIHVESTSYELPQALRDVIAESFKVSSFNLSIFFGSPGPRQKTTIQIFNRNEILGYVKLSDDRKIADLFRKETDVLNFLKACDITNVPTVLYCDKIATEWVFIQSTSKSTRSTSSNRITTNHIQFAKELFEHTRRTLNFEQTDLYSDILYLKSIRDTFGPQDWKILSESMSTLENHFEGIVAFGFMHGDFTPWNTYIEKSKLYAFDFEYAGYSYPPYMDIIHFILQICILVKNQSIDETYKTLRSKEYLLPVTDKKHLILSYLIRTFSHYSRLFDGRFDPQDRSYKIWIGLMDKYNKL